MGLDDNHLMLLRALHALEVECIGRPDPAFHEEVVFERALPSPEDRAASRLDGEGARLARRAILEAQADGGDRVAANLLALGDLIRSRRHRRSPVPPGACHFVDPIDPSRILGSLERHGSVRRRNSRGRGRVALTDLGRRAAASVAAG